MQTLRVFAVGSLYTTFGDRTLDADTFDESVELTVAGDGVIRTMPEVTILIPAEIAHRCRDAGFDVPMYDAGTVAAMVELDACIDMLLELRQADEHELADAVLEAAERWR